MRFRKLSKSAARRCKSARSDPGLFTGVGQFGQQQLDRSLAVLRKLQTQRVGIDRRGLGAYDDPVDHLRGVLIRGDLLPLVAFVSHSV